MTAPSGPIPTWTVWGIVSGEPMTVDARTFDPAHHVPAPPAAPETAPKPKKKGE